MDGQDNVSIPLTFKGMIGLGGDFPASQVTGQTEMPMWSQGPHTIKVSIKYTYVGFILTGSKTLYLGQPEPTQLPPVLTIISPQNQATYNTNQVPISYNVNSKVIWSYYALDTTGEPKSSDWIPFHGNITLTGLSEGSHELIISVKTEANPPSAPVSEQTISFNANNNAPIPTNHSLINPSPNVPEFPSLLLLLTIMMAVIGLSVYFKKRKN